MTIHVADIASYQGALSLADLRAAGFAAINVKVSHGLGQKSVHPDVSTYVRDARAAGMDVSTFHWLTNEASGTAQAVYAHERMLELPGGTAGLAHVVDVESEAQPPTELIWRDYCAAMASLLGRDIFTYSGYWWWRQARYAAGWAPSPFSPWLWSAPRTGYPGAYPGDVDDLWLGYGPWSSLAAMQYQVAEVAGIKVSQSAVRDHALWAAAKGEQVAVYSVPASTSLRDEFDAAFPGRDRTSDGTIGDPAHADRSSDHNLDETGTTPSEDPDNIDEAHARDVTALLNRSGWSMERCVQIIVGRHRAGLDNRLQNVIYNGRIWSRSWGWTQRAYGGVNPHIGHAHFGFRYGSGPAPGNPEQITKPWGILAAIEQEEESAGMELTTPLYEGAPSTSWTNRFGTQEATVRNALAFGAFNATDAETAANTILAAVRALQPLMSQTLALVQNSEAVDVAELAAALAPLITAGVVEQLPDLDGASPAEVREQVEAGVRTVLGTLG